MNFIYVIIGGSLGAVLRYIISGMVQEKNGTVFPLGTISVNTLGCFLFGFLAEISSETLFFSPKMRMFIFMGLIGAFTTFSTFVWEAYQFLKEGSYLFAAVYITLSILTGFTGLIAGIITARLVN
jgi:CrcB protein